jgi:hypothetical protein
MSEETYTKTSLSDIPMLKSNANYAIWKQAVENQLLLASALGIVDGSEKEPFRDDNQPRQEADGRRIRAGSAAPTTTRTVLIPGTETTAATTTARRALTDDEMKQWYRWQRKEDKVQGVIIATVSKGILVDLLELTSAKEMWDFIEETHRQDT